MLPIRPETDPIVEILRLAYRRGMFLLQQASQTKDDVPPSSKEDALNSESSESTDLHTNTGQQISPNNGDHHE